MALLIRREVDELSQADLTALRQAFIDLGWGNEGSTYTRLVAIYGLPLPMLSVHHRPQFLAWNRAYLTLFERALGLPLPWWDFTSERTRNSGIPAAFAEETVDGAPNPLFRGPFQGVPESQWRSALPEGGPMPQFTSRTPSQEAALPEPEIVQRVLDAPSFKDFQDFVENIHDNVHVWVGGAMGTIPLAAYDPFIWPLNAAIDRMWWLWQRAHPDAELPEELLASEVRPFGRAVADLLDVRRLGYTYSEADVPGPVSVMAGYSADTPAGPDSLQVGPDVRTLCTLLAARAVEPPISIGLFGDWGSGKTFFMTQMQQRIRLLAAESRRAQERQRESAFCTHICQITFNAWHYADTELWPSLASHIFESMASPEARGLVDPDEAAILRAREEQAGLARKLAQARVQADMLAAQATQSSASDEIERLSREFAQAAVKEVAPDAEEDLQWLGDQASVELPDAAETSVDDVRRLVRTGSLVRQLWRELPIQGWLAVAFLVIAVAVILAAWLVASRLAGPIAGLAASLALSVGTVLAVAAGPLHVVAQTASRVTSVLARVREREAERRRELRRRREAADKRIADLEREIGALQSGRQLYDFALQRSASAEYLEHIGAIGLIRRDFDRMSQLLRRQPSSRSAGDDLLPRIDRIVLYIDDLDRCSPAQVVQVLEAVHLLLAMPLFAVVVGVDVRWLVRSLQQRRTALNRDDAWKAGAASDLEGWSATAMNYMEKIFQIPYTLRPMSPEGYERLIERLVPVAPAVEASAAQAAPMAGDAGAPSAGEAEEWLLPLSVPDADDEGVDLTPRGLVIDPAEQDFMKLLSAFVPTPRAAKRLTNTYRLIRASLAPGELDRLVASGDYRVVLTLLGVMVGYARAATNLFRRVVAAGGDVRWCDLVGGLRASERPDDQRLAAALDQLAREEGARLPETVGAWQGWVRVVGRYSFEVGHLIDVMDAQPVSAAASPTKASSPSPRRRRRQGRRPFLPRDSEAG